MRPLTELERGHGFDLPRAYFVHPGNRSEHQRGVQILGMEEALTRLLELLGVKAKRR